MGRQQHTSSSHRIAASPLRSKNSASRIKGNKSNNSQISPKPVKIHDAEKQNSSMQKDSFKASKVSLNKSIEQEVETSKLQAAQLQQNITTLQAQKEELQTTLFNHQRELTRLRVDLNARAAGMDSQSLQSMNQLLIALENELQTSLKRAGPPPASENLNILKDKLVQRIGNFEQALLHKYTGLQQRLEQREAELDSVKKLFVEKLRELESNFAEIGDHIMANQANQ